MLNWDLIISDVFSAFLPAEGEQEGNQENWDCFWLTPPADASMSRAHRRTRVKAAITDAKHECGVQHITPG